ncbi:MAG: hypothetical protein LQ340_003338 [Diploschistes diacapsis]|nr:MAG: hypothetical protein LQ340_003338 [Diploschistes diacapsis]
MSLRRLLPRHAKGYLWICFLVLVFGSMILSDNGFSPYSILTAPFAEGFYDTFDHGPVEANVHSVASDPVPPVGRPPLPSTGIPRPAEEVRKGVPVEGQGKALVFGSGATTFTPDDIVILFKTGATALWRRVPIHLSTSFANSSLVPNVIFYSDNSDHIAGRPIVDVLANVSSTLKAHPDFELYHKVQEAHQSNLYLEAAAIDGDFYLPGGWRLDKYKFLPLVQHAAANYPGKKWYVYMEDDNYLFWHSLFAWLGTFDPSTPLFLGSPAARLGEDFAGGGSGFVISGAALEATFGGHPDLADKWESYAQERCCGDQVLSHVMAEMGVPRDRRYDNTGWAGLQALPTWKMGFGEWNWCSPLFNVHKTHQADVSELFVFERRFQQMHGERAVLRYSDLFVEMVLPYLVAERVEWDNEASQKWFASGSEDAEALGKLSKAEREKKAWFSAKSCKLACKEWEECLTWKYADDNCGLASTVSRGRKVDAGILMRSGWMMGRIERLAEGKDCKGLGY